MHNSGKGIFVSLLLIFFTLSSLFAQTKLLRFPDIHGSHVVFCYAGDIWKASAGGGMAKRPSRYSAAKNIEDFELSPKGERALFVARGDIFPNYFREANLGSLIGKRTWGGVVGISGKGPFIDGGSAYVPLSGTNDKQGNWIIEGYGVEPDIVVENDPKSVLQGRDPQLERGIEEVLKKMNESPMKLPSRAPDPVKTK